MLLYSELVTSITQTKIPTNDANIPYFRKDSQLRVIKIPAKV